MVVILASIIIRYHMWLCIVTILLRKHWGSHSALDYVVKNWICSLWGPEDDSIESKHVAHVSIVVDIAINCCVRLLHLVPILFNYKNNWTRYDHKCTNVFMWHTVIVVWFYWNLNFLDRFLKTTQLSNFMKIRPVGPDLFHADGQTDRYDET